jgi:RNA polymerase sigma factor (TIGR02999 family)
MQDSAITGLLHDWIGGDRRALFRIIPELYSELRHAAAGCLRREQSCRTLQPTELVHEAYAALAAGRPVRCHNRGHFLNIVRRLMLQILTHSARRRRSAKRGGGAAPVALNDERALYRAGPAASPADALEEALAHLHRLVPRRNLMVEMHFRFGCTVREVAEAADASIRTVERELSLARTWLEQQIRPGINNALRQH